MVKRWLDTYLNATMSETELMKQLDRLVELIEDIDWREVPGISEADAYSWQAQSALAKSRLAEIDIEDPHAGISRRGQVLYALNQFGRGVWVTPRQLSKHAVVGDKDFRLNTVNSAMDRMATDGRLESKKIDGRTYYSLQDTREVGADVGDTMRRVLAVIYQLTDGRGEPSVETSSVITHTQMWSADDESAGNIDTALNALREMGLVDKYMTQRENWAFWLTDNGLQVVSSEGVTDEWTGAL